MKIANARIAAILGAALLTAVSMLSHAQPTPGQFARVVILKPKPDQAAEFTAGYKRHLAWHKNNNDPWTWYGWTFVLGDRLGQFMDGTFGHALTNFDQAVNPAADSADNEVNVSPYADFVSHGIYERLEAASSGAPLPDASPFLALSTYIVNPGQESTFEAAIARLAKRPGAQRLSWYKLKVGGPLSQYLLMRPAQTFSGGAALVELELPAGLVERAQSELLRYQPALSYAP
jgi:hypothetical protein